MSDSSTTSPPGTAPPPANAGRRAAGRAQSLAWRVLAYATSVLLAFLVGGAVIVGLGHDPIRALEAVLTTSFSTQFGIVETLHKWVAVVLCALAFTVPLATGKFNIGAEGQLLMGATGAAAVGITWSDLPALVLLPSVLVAGILAGAVWAGIAGFLLVRFGVNEILSTVLLNFVSFELVNFVATQIWPDVGAGHPATLPVGDGALLPTLGPAPSMHAGVPIAIAVCAAIAVWMRRSPMGFEMTATGSNPRASAVHGIRTSWLTGVGLLIGGGFAGLAGAIEVSGVHGNMLEGMQSNFLILGIIVGLMARRSVVAVPFVAFGIAVLEVGASSMQRAAQVPVELVLIIEALILLFVLLSDLVRSKSRAQS